ncbi:uncharacterized protein LOC132038098 [Lycium ferocissimum]|uniref:uncharacterized protein LOC132038098 n=1 Tax=Lycium ferocissimum TaxID=112874 RepID=UPI002814A1D1|nr:uncharacterized protein LOC132038098 [Lycium ferocissimum]
MVKYVFFFNENIDVDILEDTAQQITVKLFFQELHKNMVVTMVYAKCDEVERVNLWDCLCNLSATMSMPWLIGGDFNVILNEEEKIGGLPVFPQEYEDFACCVNSCELSEVNFKGSPFTWWNGRTNGECIFKRLDRMLVNDLFQSWFGQIEVDHLSRTGSDHAPLLLSCTDQTQTFIKTFKFLKFWTEHADFPDVVRQHWQGDSIDVFLAFKQKLKSVKTALSQWSKHTFGDIFKQLSIREEIVRIKEDLFEEFPTEGNRMILQRAQAELKKYMHYEEEFWRQKAGFDYEAISFYQKQFTQEPQQEEFSLLEHIQELVTEEDNVVFCSIPSLEEVRQAVFELAGDSASGPDGLSGLFYQSCWDIVGVDVHKVVKAYFEGHTLPKSITHTNLVLLPKKNEVETFSDMRPISLSNFINKIISRVLHDKIDHILPRLISANQSGFVKGRNIIENVLLTQEIMDDIRLRGKSTNVVLKLDMTKAYDRVSWLFLTKVLRKMGFAERSVDLVWRLLANNWYSVLVNGQPHGFFHSTRGVKQGDPLSPALFILSAEVLTRALNSLFEISEFKGYGMPKWSANLNHLAYADDTIIFASADNDSLNMIMKVLQDYEKVSGQLINKRKSSFYMFAKVSQNIVQGVATTTGFSRGSFPFVYLGCPISHARKRKTDYSELIKKVKDKLQAWKGRLLSPGGKVADIKLKPPKCVIKEIHQIFAKFFWSNKEDVKSRHWSAWLNMCFPKEEGGLGFRSLFDVSKALCAKLWWNFRTSNSLWANYLWNKYCKKQYPQYVQWKGGALYYTLPDQVIDESVEDVSELLDGNDWNFHKLQQLLPGEIVNHIQEELLMKESSTLWDKAWWMMTSSGKFTVSSAWNLLRQKGHISTVYKQLWIKGVPFKISFFLWRLWKFKLPVDEVLASIGINVKQVVQIWWNTNCHYKLKPIIKAVPGMIMWKIWKWRNTKLHGGSMSMHRVIHEISQNIHLLCKVRYPVWQNIPHKWLDIIDYFEQFRPSLKCTIVTWRVPASGWYKCNSDGASRGNPGPSSVAFCIRDDNGDLVYAAAQKIADGNNLVAEAVAIKQGIKYCMDHQLYPLLVETDSLAMKMFIRGTWEVPWCISMILKDINRLIRGQIVEVEHIYRKGNCLEDFLANYVFDFAGTQQFNTFQELPSMARKLLNIDKARIPNRESDMHRTLEFQQPICLNCFL